MFALGGHAGVLLHWPRVRAGSSDGVCGWDSPLVHLLWSQGGHEAACTLLREAIIYYARCKQKYIV